MATVKNLAGQRFGRLVAIECVGRTANGNAKWLCKCDCGSEKVVASWGLVSGRTHSCGCIKREQNVQMWTKHGETRLKRTRLYGIWAGMKTRCYNEHQNASYKKYGARGIKMCKEWIASYETFRGWALSNGYQDNLSIDRIDPNGPYSPENCRWATDKEQQNNRRNNHIIKFCEESKTLSEWSEISGIPYKTLEHRINRGWPVEDALQTPVRVLSKGKYVFIDTNLTGGDKNQKSHGKLSARFL